MRQWSFIHSFMCTLVINLNVLPSVLRNKQFLCDVCWSIDVSDFRCFNVWCFESFFHFHFHIFLFSFINICLIAIISSWFFHLWHFEMTKPNMWTLTSEIHEKLPAKIHSRFYIFAFSKLKKFLHSFCRYGMSACRKWEHRSHFVCVAYSNVYHELSSFGRFYFSFFCMCTYKEWKIIFFSSNDATIKKVKIKMWKRRIFRSWK